MSEHDDDPFYVGWGVTPSVDRRFLLGAVPATLAGVGGIGAFVASALGDPGAGAWHTGKLHTVRGILSEEPYPIIRVPTDVGQFPTRTVLVVAQGKCTAAMDFSSGQGYAIAATGVLIERKGRQMLEVPPLLGDWAEPIDENFGLYPPPVVKMVAENITLRGTILDTKCFMGVMRPSHGRTHKACASLCIRGGIPPSFRVVTKQGQESVMLLTDENGQKFSDAILPFVADPIAMTGRVIQIGDSLQFRAAVSTIARIGGRRI